MPFCPECRYEYRPGFSTCSDCGATLVAALPAHPQGSPQAASTADVVVARVHGQPMAEMWSELLANHGIASRMSPLTGVADTVYPTDTVYDVLVSAADAARASAILPPPDDCEATPRQS